jgi:O-antigen/teichoic acid export membrane protein
VATYWIVEPQGLVTISYILLASRLIVWLPAIFWTHRNVGFFLNPLDFDLKQVKALGSYGIRNAVGQIATLIIRRSDLFWVTAFLGLRAAAFYTIGATFVRYLSQLALSIATAFTPRFAQLKDHTDPSKSQLLLTDGTRFISSVCFFISAGVAIFGPYFIVLWIGPETLHTDWKNRSDTVMIILTVASVPIFALNLIVQFLLGTGRVSFLMWLTVGEAVANLTFSLILVRPLECAGVALGTLIPSLIVNAIILPIYGTRCAGLNLMDFFRKSLQRPLALGFVVITVNLAIVRLAPPHSWFTLGLEALASTAVAIVTAWVFVLAASERTHVLHLLQNFKSPVEA